MMSMQSPTTIPNSPGDRKILGLNSNVFLLGVVSLLTDVSSEMIFTLVPLFLANVLGTATAIIGLIGGLSGTTDAVFKIFSGWLSDRVSKRKPLAVLGYGISTLSKPFMYIASSWGVVLAVRFTDRIGKGVRGSPRDALVADYVSASERGRGFGLHRAMDTLGAVIGLALAALIIYQIQGGGLELHLRTYQWLVLIGIIPAVLGVLILLIFVHEKRRQSANDPNNLTSAKPGVIFNNRFKVFLAIMALFTLGNPSDFFVILRAQNLGAPLIQITLMLVLFNVVYAAVSLPAGVLSDKLGRRKVIILGWAIYALVYLGFALAEHIGHIWILFAAFGIYYGLVEGVARAFVADLIPKEKRGTAYGLYHGVVGIILLPASLIAGWLWDAVGPAYTFYFGAALALLAMIGMAALIRERHS